MAKDVRLISLLERATQIAIGQGVAFGAQDDPLKTAHPELWEWLSRTELGGGKVKSPARITIQLTPGGVAVALMDAGLACSMDVACTHCHDWPTALAEALNAPNPPMRFWDGKEPRVRTRRKDS